MKYRLSEKIIKCEYEDYNPKTNSMQMCGCDSHVLAGKKGVCLGHLNFALQSDRKPQVYALDGQEVTIKKFKELASNHTVAEIKEDNTKWI